MTGTVTRLGSSIGSVSRPRSALPVRSWRISRGVAPGVSLTSTDRVLLAERLEQRREHVEADGHAADQPDGAADRALRVENAGAGPLEILEHPLAEAEQRGAGRRDADLAAEPEEQLLLQLLFEQQDLTADRRLRQVQLLARRW